MQLKPLLKTIGKIASDNGLSTPYLCGGVPRDRYMNRLDNVLDFDLTTGDDTIHILARKVIEYFRITNFRFFDNGHSEVIIDNLKLDFSSNFKVPQIEEILVKAGIKHPSNLLLELYSRDFTCNTLLMNLELDKIYDLSQRGTKDIDRKMLVTCLPPEQTFTYNTKRIIRIIYLAAKLNFEVDPEIISWMRANNTLITQVPPLYNIKKINEALEFDRNKTISLLQKMDLFKFIPLSQKLINNISGA